MPSSQEIQVDLAQYAPISSWVPKAGDFVVWHGFITHWFGIVSSAQPNGAMTIIKSGLPITLFTMHQEQMEKSVIKIHVSKIKASRGGEWAVTQVKEGQIVWYV